MGYLRNLCVICSLAVFLGIQPAKAGDARGLVSITFDDANITQYNHGLRLAVKYGIVGTLFVPTHRVRDEQTGVTSEWKMDWDQVREFYNAGWEIGAHGRTHKRLTEIDASELESEIAGPLEDIKAQIGLAPVSYSSPFGAFNDAIIKKVMDYYDYHLSWKGHGGRNPRNEIDQRYIGRLEVVKETSSAEICGEMVRAAVEGDWIVLLFHGLVTTSPQKYEVDVQKYEEILLCAALLQGSEVVDVLTVRDAMARISELD